MIVAVVRLPRQLLVGQGVAGAAAVDPDAGLEFLAWSLSNSDVSPSVAVSFNYGQANDLPLDGARRLGLNLSGGDV